MSAGVERYAVCGPGCGAISSSRGLKTARLGGTISKTATLRTSQGARYRLALAALGSRRDEGQSTMWAAHLHLDTEHHAPHVAIGLARRLPFPAVGRQIAGRRMRCTQRFEFHAVC